MEYKYSAYHPTATDEELINDLKRVYGLCKSESLTIKQYTQHGKYNCSTFLRRFGSWNESLKKADISAAQQFWTEEELFKNIEAVWVQKGCQPRRRDMDNKSISHISSGAYLRNFGKWSEALKAFESYVNTPIEEEPQKAEINSIVESHIQNTAKLVEQLSRFTSFIQHMDGKHGYISFRSGFLGREEDYKSCIAGEARKELNFANWKESWVGTGKIADCAAKAMSKAGNLVNMNQQIDFKNRLNPHHQKYQQDAEQVLYDIYCNPSYSESEAFANAVDAFGAKYDTIAFLFFIKDDTRFLPISPSHFDKGFAILGIEYATSYQCERKNYYGYIDILKEIHNLMENMLPIEGTLRLIDAHSFVWIIQQERFMNWEPDIEQNIQIEQATEKYIQHVVTGTGGRQSVTASKFIRSANVVKETKKRANGI